MHLCVGSLNGAEITHSRTRSASGAFGGSGNPASAAFFASFASKFLMASLIDVIFELDCQHNAGT
jgi:hypothetical protein